jgi:8-oxo-dGTP pyrophosphatase MutT (NUDIX family)
MTIKIINRKLFRENLIFNFYLDHLLDSQGNEVEEYFVVEPKRLSENRVAGIAILPIIDGQIGLLEIYRPALRQMCLEIPHGLINEYESAKSAAIRELEEETGIVSVADDLMALGEVAPDSGLIGAKLSLFYVQNRLPMREQIPELGLGKFKLFSLVQIKTMIETSVIFDSITLVSLFRYLNLIGNINWTTPSCLLDSELVNNSGFP